MQNHPCFAHPAAYAWMALAWLLHQPTFWLIWSRGDLLCQLWPALVPTHSLQLGKMLIYITFFFFFKFTHCRIWKFPGQGLNAGFSTPIHLARDWDHASAATWAATVQFLIHCSTAKTPYLTFDGKIEIYMFVAKWKVSLSLFSSFLTRHFYYQFVKQQLWEKW